MQEVTFCVDLNHLPRLLFVNENVKALLGHTADDFLSNNVTLQDRIHPADADVAHTLFSPDHEDQTGTVRFRMRGADGRIRCVKGGYEKAHDTSSGHLLLRLSIQDVRSIEEPGDQTLVANFKALLENTSDYIYVKNCNHVILAAGKSVAELTEGDANWTTLAGKTDYDLHPEPEADRFYRLEKQLLAEGRCVSEIQQIAAVDGTVHWIDNRKYPVNGANGEIAGLFGIAPDITVHVIAERRLRESEESLREAQKIGGLGSFVLDLGSKVWKVSDELDALLGIGPEYDHTLKGTWPLIHPQDREVIERRLKGCFAGDYRQFEGEYRVIRQTDGEVRWIHTRGRLELDGDGKPITLRGTVQDITESKRAEEALRKSEESLRQAQKIASLSSYRLDLRTGRCEGPDTLEEIFGVGAAYPRTVAAWLEILHPDERERMAAELAHQIASQDSSFNAEYRIIRPSDGALRWLHGMGRIEYAADGSPAFLYGTIQDITDNKRIELALRESKELLRLFIKHAPVGLVMCDAEMHYLAISERWLEIYGFQGQDLLGRCHYEVFPHLPGEWKNEHRRVLNGETIETCEGSLKKRDGSEQRLRRKLRPWFRGDGGIGGIILFNEDITAQKHAEERLKLAASVFTHACEGIVITDASGLILDVNETFTRITGYRREEVLGRNPSILKSGLQSPEFYAKMWNSLLEDGRWTGEIWNRTKDGDVYPEMLTISAVRDESGRTLRYVALFADITELKDKQRRLEKIAHYDVLTGLPNRVLLADRLRQAMMQARRRKQFLAVAYLDLDGFKEVNDNYGHVVGDQFLSSLASRMKFALRECDTLARLGGDEFVALLIDLPENEEAVPVLRRLLSAASKPVRIGANLLHVSASIGVAYYPQGDDIDADQLLRQADQAMYQAKVSGKNRYHVFGPFLDSSGRNRYESLTHVRQALADCQLVLHYQPKVNMRTGTVTGAEALLRLQHPERGLLSPAMFMPATEDHPLAVEIGEWVIENALCQMEAWSEGGLDIPVSVNVSGFHLQRPDFVDRLRTLLAAHAKIEPSRLGIEVLESSAIMDVIQASEVLEACHQLGVSIALDDFGTGYSSLTYLKQLPAHVLKIDRSFVSGMVDNPEDLTIVEGVLGLAKAFGRRVIAEGVETAEHGVMLLKLGCELAQGYGISPPIPAPEFPSWMSTWRPDPRWTQVRALHSGNRALLHASVEHRALLAGLEAVIEGKRYSTSAVDIEKCRLSAWLDSRIPMGSGSLPGIQTLVANHRRFHSIAQRILAALAQGDKSDCTARLDELREVRDELLKQLEAISTSRSGSYRVLTRPPANEKVFHPSSSKDGKKTQRVYPAKKNDPYPSRSRRPAPTYPD